jgi:competence protein ComEC
MTTSQLKYKTKIKKTRAFMSVGDEIAAQKERLFLWVPVAFGAGISAYFAWPYEPSYDLTFPFLFLLLPAAFWSYRRHHDSLIWFFGHLMCAAMLVAVMGFAFAQIGTMRHGTKILEKPTGATMVRGVVESVEDLGGKKGSRAVLTDIEIEDVPPEQTPRRVRVTFKKDEGLKAGARIEALVSLDPPSRAVAPGSYDFRRHLSFNDAGRRQQLCV